MFPNRISDIHNVIVPRKKNPFCLLSTLRFDRQIHLQSCYESWLYDMIYKHIYMYISYVFMLNIVITS